MLTKVYWIFSVDCSCYFTHFNLTLKCFERLKFRAGLILSYPVHENIYLCFFKTHYRLSQSKYLSLNASITDAAFVHYMRSEYSVSVLWKRLP